MSDIQRYSNQRDIDNLLSAGNSFVKYDDHIAEVEYWQVHCRELRELNIEAEARIDELEAEVDRLRTDPIAKIKAEGIEEMLDKCHEFTTQEDMRDYANSLRGGE